MVILSWIDSRLQWRTESSIGNWTFPSSVYYPIKDVWVPRFRLANCQSERCMVKPQEARTLELTNKGGVTYEAQLMLRSNCNLNLTCKIHFPKPY